MWDSNPHAIIVAIPPIINGHEKYFAVCPICDNLIQIIGQYKHEEGERRKPFGKHYKGNIAELANYDEDAYRRCPYHNPYLIKNFDEITQSLEKKIHIKISYTIYSAEDIRNAV